MGSKRCAVKNCGNTLTTTRGTYTFYNDLVVKSEAAKLCKKHGGIIAPLNTQEEFDAVQKFAYKCRPWCSTAYYHTGLYLNRNETRFYSDCTEWDWEKHDKLYRSEIGKGPCWDVVWRPLDKIQMIFIDGYCTDSRWRTICFNPVKTEQDALVETNHSEGFDRFTTVTAFLVLASLTVALALTVVKSKKKIKEYEEKLSL